MRAARRARPDGRWRIIGIGRFDHQKALISSSTVLPVLPSGFRTGTWSSSGRTAARSAASANRQPRREQPDQPAESDQGYRRRTARSHLMAFRRALRVFPMRSPKRWRLGCRRWLSPTSAASRI
jgi:hypothetical protein